MPEAVSPLTAINLFSGQPQHENFNRLHHIMPSSRLTASRTPHRFPAGNPIPLPASFESMGRSVETEEFLDVTDTAALLVLHDGKVVHEQYRLTGGPTVQWISWSVAKSFTSALVGIAVAHGHIRSIEEPISNYIDTAPGSAYEGTRIKDILQMSSGARWNEDYSDPDSDIVRLGQAMSSAGSLDSFVANMAREYPPGTLCRYNSADTQALGTLLARATGRTVTDYMQEHLYEPLGMEDDGYWLLDAHGTEMSFGGINLTPRDFAKIGELYRLGGTWSGKQIIPADWVHASVTPDAPHVQWGQPVIAGMRLPEGYGYQWWLSPGGRGQYSAIGVYNQWVFVSPADRVTIVKLSATRSYGTTMGEETNYSGAHEYFLQALAAHTGALLN